MEEVKEHIVEYWMSLFFQIGKLGKFSQFHRIYNIFSLRVQFCE